VAGSGDFLRKVFSFVFAQSSREERVAAYLLREHARGRRASEILEDPYVRNRLSPDQQGRLLERPEIVHALGEHDLADARTALHG
jgi:hypothetical protein